MPISKPAHTPLAAAAPQAPGAAVTGHSVIHRNYGGRRSPLWPGMPVVAGAGKGGGGKTTGLINLACVARHEGLRVGIVDADPQRSTSQWRRARGTADIPVSSCNPDCLDKPLEAARRAKFDLLFLDLPPDMTQAFAGIQAADFVLLPTRPTFFDVRVTNPNVELLSSCGRSYGVFLNAAPPRREGVEAPMARDAREAILGFTTRLWKNQITHRHVVPYATVAGRGVIEIDKDGPATNEYRALWAAVLHEIKSRRR